MFVVNNMNKNYRAKSGFTLIELLIVIVILGLLMSLVAPAMFSKVDSSKIKTAQAQMEMFRTALETYRLDIGTYPNSLNELRASSIPGWDGPYLPKSLPLDPWGNAYIYKIPGENGTPFLMMSLGKDGKEGGNDDASDIVYIE
ncbi:MAG: type II secretion system major pseudopilin GspG [Hellea sp.]